MGVCNCPMIKEQVIKKSALAPTVLIAGGAGFVGSHLAEVLLVKEARVIVLDNLKTGKDIYVNSLLDNPKFALFDVDISQKTPDNIQSVDYIFHLAGIESYPLNQETADLNSLLINAMGTKNLLDLAVRSEAKFLLASSIDVYQGFISPINLEHYFGKTQEEEKRYSLAEAKRYAEALVWEYFKRHQTDVRIARLPIIYGPRMNLNMSGSLGHLLKDMVEDHNLTIFGEGTEKEFYLYISDAITGIIKSLLNKNTEGKIYTLVPDEPHTVLETTYLVKGLAQREIQVEFKPKTSAALTEPKIPDLGNLKDLKWEPKVLLKEGIIKTLKWLGYEVNEQTFKASKLIEKKEKEKPLKITTLAVFKETEKENILKKPSLFKKLKERLKKKTGEKNGKPSEKPEAEITEKTAKSKGEIQTPSKKSKFFTAGAAALIALFITFLLVPAVQTYSHIFSGVKQIKSVPAYVAQLDSESAKNASNSAFQHFYNAKVSLKNLSWLFTITGNKDLYTSGSKLLSSATYFSKTTYNLSKAAGPFVTIWDAMKPNSEIKFDENQFTDSKLFLENASSSLQLAQAEFKHVKVEKIPGIIRQKAEAYQKVLGKTSDGISLANAMTSDLSNILGVKKPKKYLVLFQNSNELRPTGGFIGSYAIVEIEGGKITKLTIDDIYNPDGQIDLRNITVPSPAPIAKFLQEPNLHIRNANWNPDFSQSSQDIANLFFKVTGEEFDGVIAVDLHLAENLLKVTGPVFLTAFNEEITDKNLYERAQYHSDFNYQEGSNQKRSFLTLLGSKLLEKIFSLPKESMPQFLGEIQSSLEQKHLLIHLFNSSFNAKLEDKGWAGNLAASPGDYLYVVNANLGGTKANYYVDQEIRYSVSSLTRDGLLRGELTLIYEHTGQDSAWPGGPYTNYVRVLTQAGSKLTGAKTSLGNQAEKDILSEMIIDKAGIYNSFETSFKLEPKEKAILTINYDLPQSLSLTKDSNTYSLYWQKQPGTQDDKATFVFSAPFGTEIASTSKNLSIKVRLADFSGVLNTDTVFSCELSPYSPSP